MEQIWMFMGIVLCLLILPSKSAEAWGSSTHDKIKLKDIETLTLYQNRMATGRRSRPVPQLQCVGGSAGCSFIPQVVQCTNKGSDGVDIQWECKTDMDNAYRFGTVEVICEGYDYPSDPYVLKGSCGLEYTIDYTLEGQKKYKPHNYYGQSGYHESTSSHNYSKKAKSTSLGDIILLIVIGIIIFALYKTCLHSSQHSPTSQDYPGPDGGMFGSWFGGHSGSSAPPPPGFRTDYTDTSCGSSRSSHSSGSGFWNGLLTGGMLGYMFGNRNQGNTYHTHQPGYSDGYSWTRNTSHNDESSSSSSSGTRTASGFGGTRRR